LNLLNFVLFLKKNLIELNVKKDRDSLERKFKATDLDNSGYLSYDEFETLIQQIFKNKMESEEIRRLFRIMDKDSSGQITMEGEYYIFV
jgi:Ca2+-binding EF-hand superfamily protein